MDVPNAIGPSETEPWVLPSRRKVGLMPGTEDDDALVQDLLERMAANRADFTQTFRRLSDAEHADGRLDPAFDDWIARWRVRLARETSSSGERRAAMRAVNPRYIPRNHLVEAALNAAIQDGDLGPFQELSAVLAHPFDDQPGRDAYDQPARPDERVTQTFCGT